MKKNKTAPASEALELLEKDLFEQMLQKSEGFVRLMTYYRCAMLEIETKFKVLNEHYSLEHDRNPINTIKTRLKRPLSIKNKLEALGFEMSEESIEKNLNDIAGVRVICSFVEDVYTLADALLLQDDIKIIEKKDYIKSPKENGYRSLHLIVSIPIFLSNEKREMRVEIQLRTIAMDIWASLEHQIKYKKDAKFPSDLSKELRDCADLSARLDEKLNDIHKKAIERSYIIKP